MNEHKSTIYFARLCRLEPHFQSRPSFNRVHTAYERKQTANYCVHTLYERNNSLYERLHTLYERDNTLYERLHTLYERNNSLCGRLHTLYEPIHTANYYVHTAYEADYFLIRKKNIRLWTAQIRVRSPEIQKPRQ